MESFEKDITLSTIVLSFFSHNFLNINIRIELKSANRLVHFYTTSRGCPVKDIRPFTVKCRQLSGTTYQL